MELMSSATNKYGTGTSLSTLYIRHGKASDHYRQLASQLEAGKTAEAKLIESLMNYHQQAQEFFAKVLRDLPDTPVKPNRDMQFGGTTQLPTAATANTLASLCKADEEGFLKLYERLLDNNGLPDGMWKAIQKQSERAQEVVRKLDRISKAGDERDMQV